ncbi:MAG: hypothetical protein RL385_1350 [Pseudomonadota bacterium]|jgi:type I restriction enzyme S subunit
MTSLVELGRVAQVFNGKTPAKGDQRSSGHAVLKIRDIDEDGGFRGCHQSFVDPSFAEQFSDRMIRRGDTLILNAAHNADYVASKVALAGEDVERSLATGEWLIVRPIGADARFVHYWVRSADTRRALRELVKGIHLYPKDVARMVIPLPTPEEQRRIADILDKADAIRRKRKEAIALTEELLRSAFLEMFGDPVTNPKGWPVKPLGELLQAPLRNGLSPASGGKFEAQVLTLSAITRGQFDASASKPGAFAVDPWEDVRVDARDFLICRGNGNVALVGSAAFPRESMKNMVFPDTMIAARIDQARVRPAFLNTIWKSPFVRRQVEAGARTTNGTFKVNQTVVEGIEIIIPPPAKQQVFADLEARVAKNAGHQHAAVEGAADLFNTLVAGAFSGALEAPR